MNRRMYSISPRAQTAMHNELARFPDTETGGVLLGYSSQTDGVCVLEATDGGYRNVLHEESEFSYDAAYVEHVGTVLSELYTPALDLVGVWHKHNSPSDIPFSKADEMIHEQLTAGRAYPCLSVLFEKTGSGPDTYAMRVFVLTASGYSEITDQMDLAPGGRPGGQELPRGQIVPKVTVKERATRQE